MPLDRPLELIRAGDYWSYDLELEAVCRCGRIRTLSASLLATHLGQEWRYDAARLEVFARRLKCGNPHCGRTGPRLTLRPAATH